MAILGDTKAISLTLLDGVKGLLKVTNNGNTLTLGSLSSSWCHIENSANINFYFNHQIHANGGFVVYNTNTSLTDNTLALSGGGGWYMNDTTWIRSRGSKSIYHDSGILRTDGTFQVGGNGADVNFVNGGAKSIGSTSRTNNNTLTLNGKVVVNPAYDVTTNSYNEGIRVNMASNAWSVLTLGGDNTATLGTSKATWCIGANRHDTTNKVSNLYISNNGSNTATMRLTGHVTSAAELGWSIRPRLGIGADPHTGYSLYVNGDTGLYGTTIAYAKISVANSGADPGTSPNYSTIELREAGRLGTSASLGHTAQNAPRLGFHWSNRYYAQLAYYANAFRFYNSTLSDYEPIYVSNVYAKTLSGNLLYGYAMPDGKSDKPYHEVATFTASSTAQVNNVLMLAVSNYYGNHDMGILRIRTRTEANSTSPTWYVGEWLTKSNLYDTSNFILTWSHDATNKIYTFKLYIYVTGWSAFNVTRLSEHTWGNPLNVWAWHGVNNASTFAVTSIPAGETSTTSGLLTTINPLNTSSVTANTISVNNSLTVAADPNGNGKGLSLYSNSSLVDTYGIHFSLTGNFGKFGDVQGDWATYFTMNANNTRGWIWKATGSAESAKAGSLSSRGVATFRGLGAPTCYIAFPVGGQYTTRDSTKTGFLKISLPRYKSDCMIDFKVVINTYNTNLTIAEYHIYGYEYGAEGWYGPVCKAYSTGVGNWTALPVRWGYDGTKVCVTIGNADTSWAYPQVYIKDIHLGYSDTDITNWSQGWSIDFTTTLPSTVVTSALTVNTQNINVAYATIAGSSSTATSATSASYATTAACANMLNAISSNEVIIGNNSNTAGSVTNATVFINYRDVNGGAINNASTAITEYQFCNRKGATDGVTVKAATFKGNLTGNATSASYATTAGSANGVTWSNVSSKPNIYYNNGGISSTLNSALTAGSYYWITSTTNTPVASSYGAIFNIISTGQSHNNTDNWIWLLGFQTSNNTMWIRNKTNNGSWGAWALTLTKDISNNNCTGTINFTGSTSLNNATVGNLIVNSTANFTGSTSLDDATVGNLLVNGAARFNTAPTSITPASSSNDTTVATTAFVKTAISGGAAASASYATTAGNADTVDSKHATDFIHYGGNDTGLGSGSPAATAKTYWADNTKVPLNMMKAYYNSNGVEYSLLFSNRGNTYGSILKWGYNDRYMYILRMKSGSWQSTDWEKIAAGYADSAGSAASATVATSASYATNANYANTAGAISSIGASDAASATDIWRRVWFAYNDNTTGRPAYDDKIVYQTSTGTLMSLKMRVGVASAGVNLVYDSTTLSLNFVFA